MAGGFLVRLSMDNKQFAADCALLVQMAARSAEVRERLVGLGDLSEHMQCVEVDAGAAAVKGEVRLRIDFSGGLASLVAAARAGEFDHG
jgi:hypothetical protein